MLFCSILFIKNSDGKGNGCERIKKFLLANFKKIKEFLLFQRKKGRKALIIRSQFHDIQLLN